MTEQYYTFKIDSALRCKFLTVLGDNPIDARKDACTAVHSAIGLSARVLPDSHGMSHGPDPLTDEPIKTCYKVGGGYWAWLGYAG